MKYVFAIIFLFFANFAYAAKIPKGEVPELPPLQPPVQGVSPNVNNNIQYSEPNNNSDSSDQPLPEAGNGEGGQPGFFAKEVKDLGQNKGAVWQWWLLGIFVVLFLGYWSYKKSNEK